MKNLRRNKMPTRNERLLREAGLRAYRFSPEQQAYDRCSAAISKDLDNIQAEILGSRQRSLPGVAVYLRDIDDPAHQRAGRERAETRAKVLEQIGARMSALEARRRESMLDLALKVVEVLNLRTRETTGGRSCR